MNKERELSGFYSRSLEVVTEPRLGAMESKATLLLLPAISQSLLESGALASFRDLWDLHRRWMIPFSHQDPDISAAAMREGAPLGRPSSAPLSPLVRWLRYPESLADVKMPELDQWIAQYWDEVLAAKGVLCVAAIESFGADELAEKQARGESAPLHYPIPLVLTDFSARDRFASLKSTLGALELRWLLEHVSQGAQNFSTLCSGMGSPVE